MQWRDKFFLLIVVAALVVGFYWVGQPKAIQDSVNAVNDFFSDPQLPDFTAYTEVKEKKSAFFDFILPLVEQENQRVAVVREKLTVLLTQQQQQEELNAEQLQWLNGLVKQYRLKARQKDSEQLLEALLLRVDEVPPSLALAQSANESAWGTSRFAVKGNNLFGQWCFREGCGLVPSDRDGDAVHEVARFSSPRASVESYIHNLNTNPAYRELREIRAHQRVAEQGLSGQTIAMGLGKYSSRGEEYIRELQAMIRVNKLDELDSL